MKLSREELFVGALVGSSFIGILKWWAIPSSIACSYLWALGGAERTSLYWRRAGVPIVLFLFLSLSLIGKPLINLIPLIICSGAFFGTLTIGYGIPDSDDNGSVLGRFIYYKVNKNEFISDILVRGIIGLAMGLSWFWLGFISLASWVIGVIILTVGFPVIVLMI